MIPINTNSIIQKSVQLIPRFFPFLFLFLGSCSVSRQDNAWGEGIEIVSKGHQNSHVIQNTSIDEAANSTVLSDYLNQERVCTAEATTYSSGNYLNIINNIQRFENSSDSCDKLVIQEGNSELVLSVKIVSIFDDKLTYTACNDASNKKYKINTSKILNIIYADGTTKSLQQSVSNSSSEDIELTESNEDSLRTNNNAVGGFILGILAIIPFYTSILFGVSGIILSLKARKEIIAHPQQKGVGFVKAGLTLSILGMSLFVVILISFFLLFSI